MRRRGGVEKGLVGLDYLQTLHGLHEEWFRPTTQVSCWTSGHDKAPRVTTVDTSASTETDMPFLAERLAQQLLLNPPSDQISHLDG